MQPSGGRGRALVAVLLSVTSACSGQGTSRRPIDGVTARGTSTGGAGAVGGGGNGGASGAAGSAGTTPDALAASVHVGVESRTPRTGTWSVNYWTWSPTYGNPLPGTETLIEPLAPALIRYGGYNNDANTPDAFDDAQLDAAVAYARAIGAEPLLQLPLLFNAAGQRATAADTTELLTHANVTRGYGIKYISIGNEPDLYPDSGGIPDSSAPAVPGYTAQQYCSEAAPIVAAAKAVDPNLRVIGPDLGYKYQSFADWLTPILQGCGDLFDIIAVHRYPFEASQATPADVQADPLALPAWAVNVRRLMSAAGAADKPLALTEMNLAYVAAAGGYPAGSILGSVRHALWLVDVLGQSAELGLWTSAFWDISDPDSFALGLVGLPPAHTPRPPYHAFALYAAHTGPTLVSASTTNPDLRAYGTRNAGDSATELVLTNWGTSPLALSIDVSGLAAASGPSTLVLPPLSVDAVEIPDDAAPSAWTYGEPQHQRGVGPEPLEVTR